MSEEERVIRISKKQLLRAQKSFERYIKKDPERRKILEEEIPEKPKGKKPRKKKPKEVS